MTAAQRGVSDAAHVDAEAAAWRRVRKQAEAATDRLRAHRITNGELLEVLEQIRAEAAKREGAVLAKRQVGLL